LRSAYVRLAILVDYSSCRTHEDDANGAESRPRLSHSDILVFGGLDRNLRSHFLPFAVLVLSADLSRRSVGQRDRFRSFRLLDISRIGNDRHLLHRRRYAVMLNRSQSQVDDEQRREGVWNKFFRHFKTLAPYIWPRGHCKLQFNIVICILIVFIGRLLAIEIPRYTKLISE
jgi:hypothetical protein